MDQVVAGSQHQQQPATPAGIGYSRRRHPVAIWVPYEQAQARIAAGGRMVRDKFAPSWWTLADPAGNEADIATTQARD